MNVLKLHHASEYFTWGTLNIAMLRCCTLIIQSFNEQNVKTNVTISELQKFKANKCQSILSRRGFERYCLKRMYKNYLYFQLRICKEVDWYYTMRFYHRIQTYNKYLCQK